MAGSGTAHLRADGDGTLLRVENLAVQFRVGRKRYVQAVSDVSFDVLAGETVGLVGESGCGKSTTARAVMQLPPPNSGRVTFDGVELSGVYGSTMREARAGMQMVLQDPVSSLNPHRTARQIVAEGLEIWGDRDTRPRGVVVDEVLAAVGLDPDTIGDRLPHAMSGGQCQRVSIARALAIQPKLLICDEPVSSLDVSVQAQILNLLEEMRRRYQLSMLFIAHDLAVVKHVSDRIVVMYFGKICEAGDPETIFKTPAHPYTQLLIDSVPEPDPDIMLTAMPPSGESLSVIDAPSGCRYRLRCPKAQTRCAEEEPVLTQAGPEQFVACHFPNV